MLSWLVERLAGWYIRKHWGRRCKEIMLGCGNCDAWLMYDYLFSKNWYSYYGHVDTQNVSIPIIVPKSTKIHHEGEK